MQPQHLCTFCIVEPHCKMEMKCVRFNLSTIVLDKNSAQVQHEHPCTVCIVEPRCKMEMKCVRFNLSTIDQTRCHSICHRTPIFQLPERILEKKNPWISIPRHLIIIIWIIYRTIKHIQYLIQIELNNDTANMTFCCSQCKIRWIFAWLFMCDIFISKIGEN